MTERQKKRSTHFPQRKYAVKVREASPLIQYRVLALRQRGCGYLADMSVGGVRVH